MQLSFSTSVISAQIVALRQGSKTPSASPRARKELSLRRRTAHGIPSALTRFELGDVKFHQLSRPSQPQGKSNGCMLTFIGEVRPHLFEK